jgi:hypothetical protein
VLRENGKSKQVTDFIANAIKTGKIELNKYHASKKALFY